MSVKELDYFKKADHKQPTTTVFTTMSELHKYFLFPANQDAGGKNADNVPKPTSGLGIGSPHPESPRDSF
ncbi:hypothetical protein Ocin01_13756 [Orchesella cincta]|uniref:Uncharacterized protein n=1 Tax=Orchesella cincta TaxID=48709 RepID=A0A1D2MIU6_ORCCI|nr:hypothetical protein Ocin01_13756 [Orchesella cincta]